MKIDGNQIKVGNILEIENRLWKVLKTQHTQPGKGGAYLQVEMKDIKEGTKKNSRFRSSESVERAVLDEKECQFLYNSEDKSIFMDSIDYEQIEIGNDIISQDQKVFLKENQSVIIQFYESSPISLILPDNISFKVIESDAVVKGQTASASYKPAMLENGIKTNVPQFIETGDEIVVSTIDGSYVEKLKK
ncbi:MAG: Elongation factor P [Alphaproteobacteria bacterium MarineAlpha5_Bin6]|nr:MAG: Elongation factor P [Alphaproteobacteria bacterium MarineAlpha5_Bin7]PPR53304.1 MAG: Elongation factor P [Alphaproteobacteria bacterium MarineAlpha5_Bin6]|tara:strand:+ start:657 stop:1226 length:570 start_codon:yes stop_codon:yes gene_type:complete